MSTRAKDLPPAPRPMSNEAYKSSGEDYTIMGIEGQMTGTRMIFHATGERTGGACVLYEVHWQPDDASVHHLHSLEDEGFYVIEGSLTLHSPDGEIVLGPGEWGWAPRNVRHGYSVGPEGARVLCFQVPGTGLPDFFRIMSASGFSGPVDDEDPAVAWADFNRWSQENFGFTTYDPRAYPPGQTIPDGDRAAVR
jgi:quercetin dioxygenase-like cupin family protein